MMKRPRIVPDKLRLYELFCRSHLEVLDHVPTKNLPESPTKNFGSEMSPNSKRILNSYTPRSRKKMKYLFKKDDNKIKSDLNDRDYVQKLNCEWGIYMENILSVYGCCPTCGQSTLKKYVNPNMPVIDLVCINKSYHLEKNECYFFQVKTSFDDFYFNLRKKYISTGSRAYGSVAHSTNAQSSPTDKIITPGYICVRLNPVYSPEGLLSDTVSIDPTKSFVLIPDYSKESDTTNSFYEYVDVPVRYCNNTITWNNDLVTEYNLFDKILSQHTVKIEQFESSQMENPYGKTYNAHVKKLSYE